MIQNGGQVVTLSVFRFAGPAARLWALSQMGAARPAMARLPGCTFWKLCGSGTGVGFAPRPDMGRWAILAVWADAAAAEAGLCAPVFRDWRAQAADALTLHLAPRSARGYWAGKTPFAPQGGPAAGPVAVLTRATLRRRHLMAFWARVPDISRAIGDDRSVLFKIGIGEVPWLHQVTFSVWPDLAAMSAFARAGGPHARAIRAVRDGDWFREELYARFTVLKAEGSLDETPATALHEAAA